MLQRGRGPGLRPHQDSPIPPRCFGHDAGTPLWHAVRANRKESATLLMEAGADVDVSDAEGRSLLSLAAGRGKEADVKFLLDGGALAVPAAHGRAHHHDHS